jgi:hypothetical protein
MENISDSDIFSPRRKDAKHALSPIEGFGKDFFLKTFAP